MGWGINQQSPGLFINHLMKYDGIDQPLSEKKEGYNQELYLSHDQLRETSEKTRLWLAVPSHSLRLECFY